VAPSGDGFVTCWQERAQHLGARERARHQRLIALEIAAQRQPPGLHRQLIPDRIGYREGLAYLIPATRVSPEEWL
jgi:hypothetical protein